MIYGSSSSKLYNNLTQNIMVHSPILWRPKSKEQQHSWTVHDEVLIVTRYCTL
jgi:ABC-type polysaccharide/polyol phosphate export permease